MENKHSFSITTVVIYFVFITIIDSRHLTSTVSDARTLLNLVKNNRPSSFAIPNNGGLNTMPKALHLSDNNGNRHTETAAHQDPGGVLVSMALKQASTDSVSTSEQKLLNDLGVTRGPNDKHDFISEISQGIAEKANIVTSETVDSHMTNGIEGGVRLERIHENNDLSNVNRINGHSEHDIHEVVSPNTLKEKKLPTEQIPTHVDTIQNTKSQPLVDILNSEQGSSTNQASLSDLGLNSSPETGTHTIEASKDGSQHVTVSEQHLVSREDEVVMNNQLAGTHNVENNMNNEWLESPFPINPSDEADGMASILDKQTVDGGNGNHGLEKTMENSNADLPAHPVDLPGTQRVLVSVVTSEQPKVKTEQTGVHVSDVGDSGSRIGAMSERVADSVQPANDSVTNENSGGRDINTSDNSEGQAHPGQEHSGAEQNAGTQQQSGEQTNSQSSSVQPGPDDGAVSSSGDSSLSAPENDPAGNANTLENKGTQDTGENTTVVERIPEDVNPLDIFVDDITYQRFPRAMSLTQMREKVSMTSMQVCSDYLNVSKHQMEIAFRLI